MTLLRHLGVISLLLALSGCAQLNWQESKEESTPPVASREPAGKTPRQRAQAVAPITAFATGMASVTPRRNALRDSDHALAPRQLGYFMDVLEARLRQAIEGTDIGMGRGNERFFITVPGAASFAASSSRLKLGIRTPLSRLADVLSEFSQTLLLVNGHTDDKGEADFNRTLSERRARTVAKFLLDNGVAIDRIVVIGHGETQPAASNATPEGRAANRRVEIVVEPVTRKLANAG